jgi:RNA polymerase sigma-70 factor (ECF subfamily)
MAGREASPERRALAREIRERLRTALTALSPRQKTVFELKHFEELSIPEIAEITGLDSGTIKSHLFRASQKIRERLRDFERGS